MDQRWHQLAKVLVNHSCKVQPGDRVMIAMVELSSAPLAHALHRQVVLAGGFPQIQYLSESLRNDVMKFGNSEQTGWVPELESYGMEWADVYFALRGASNLNQHWDIDPDILSRNQRAQGVISTQRWQKTRWCLVRVPNAHLAHQAEKDEETMLNQFFDACLIDWEQCQKEWQVLAEKLSVVTEYRIVSANTDLSFSTSGRQWVPFSGSCNMPDGEIATAPVTETLNGYIQFENPGVLGGQLIHDIYLEWDNGQLVKANSSSNQAFFQKIINTDEGSSLIGEFAFGLNSAQTFFCNDILLDEKIGGTLHIALDRAYTECGGTNQSAIHWDIIKDTRQEGSVYGDGRKIFDKGQFLF